MKIIEFSVQSRHRCELINITSRIEQIRCEKRLTDGIITLYTPHTTAAITINENADPDVPRDILYGLTRLVPDDPQFQHIEGNSDAHIKSSLVGISETLLVEAGKLQLGTWQGIFFCEFDGPRTRQIKVKLSEL